MMIVNVALLRSHGGNLLSVTIKGEAFFIEIIRLLNSGIDFAKKVVKMILMVDGLNFSEFLK